ncbi:MAG: hypothetical protein IJC80_00920 [Clostridia bacterium]|nr:hypothetical protein [Clostridia bacterium]
MALLFGLFKRKSDPTSYEFRLRRAKELHGQSIKYVTEQRAGNEDVVGRGGALCIHGDEFIVDSSGDRLFSCKIRDLEASYLMSGDGVIIKGPDIQSGGVMRTVTVHFVYYRK